MILIIGASLSEPNTSVTALCTCVCMYVSLLACGHTPKIYIERTPDVKDFKFTHVLQHSVTNSTLMDLLKMTADHDRQG